MIGSESIFRRYTARIAAFALAAALLSALGGYQLSQLIARADDTHALRSVQLLEVEERLDDAAIGLGRQIQEWKNLLLRSGDEHLYAQHQLAFKDASIGVQYALLDARKLMLELGMETTEIDRLIEEHKALLSEYLSAFVRLSPQQAESAKMADMRVMGMDRALQRRIDAVKSAISAYAKQQLHGATQGRRNLMAGLLGATALLSMAVFGFVFSRFALRS